MQKLIVFAQENCQNKQEPKHHPQNQITRIGDDLGTIVNYF